MRQMLQKVDITDAGDTDFLIGEQVDAERSRGGQRGGGRRGQEARGRNAGVARHHQGEPADALLYLGGVLPGDDARPYRGRGQRQGRYARGPEGERHRRAADPGRDRRGHVETALHRLDARHADPGAESRGLRGAGRLAARRPRGEHVSISELEEANKKALADGHKPAEGRAILLGITKASLQTRSVFSAASFQETTRVLTDAAVRQVDTAPGKERSIGGRIRSRPAPGRHTRRRLFGRALF